MNKQQRAVGAFLVGAAIAVLMGYFASSAYGDKGDFELRAYAPLLPDPDKFIGGGVAWQFAEVEPDWFIIGKLFPGHGLFADGLYVEGKGHLGGSVSVKPMVSDNGLRVFGSAWWEGGAQWVGGVSQKIGEW